MASTHSRHQAAKHSQNAHYLAEASIYRGILQHRQGDLRNAIQAWEDALGKFVNEPLAQFGGYPGKCSVSASNIFTGIAGPGGKGVTACFCVWVFLKHHSPIRAMCR